MLARVSSAFCAVCGAVLRDGVCPNGHPQRAQRRHRHRRHARRRYRGLWTLLILFLLVSGATYAGLVWYPQRAAGDLMRPSSKGFAEALETYRSTVTSFPPGPTDPQALVDTSNTLVTVSPQARDRLAAFGAELDRREPPNIPVVSSRPPLQQARDVREQMIAFDTRALEVVARLEAVAGYVTEVAPALPQLDTLRSTLGTPREPAEVRAAVAAATPVADQMLADLRAITPPDELGGLHSSLLAIARRIRADLDDLVEASQGGAGPVVTALVQNIGGDLDSFRETFGTAPKEARQAGVAVGVRDVQAVAQQVIAGLRTLRDVHGLSGLTVPEA
jgi:hypothetical protein